MTLNHPVGPNLGMRAIAEALVLSSMRESIVFFNLPTDIADNTTFSGKPARLGNVVKMGGLERSNNRSHGLQYVYHGNPEEAGALAGDFGIERNPHKGNRSVNWELSS